MNLAEGFSDVIQKENQVITDLESLVSQILVKKKASQKNRFDKLRGVHNLQKSIVRQNMHNVMSPISAISGYLELINISLSHEPDIKQIEHYRKQIEAGVEQVNKILEQLMEVYSDESDSITDEKEVLLDVDLNWIVSEVCQQMCCVVQDISFSEYQQPLHIRTELFVTKLIIYNLISYAGKCTSVKESIELRTSKRTNWAVFSVEFETSQNKETELKNIMAIKQDQALQSDSVSNSFDEGILTSRTLAEQIDGILDFSCTEEGLSTLSLKIPLSYSDN